ALLGRQPRRQCCDADHRLQIERLIGQSAHQELIGPHGLGLIRYVSTVVQQGLEGLTLKSLSRGPSRRHCPLPFIPFPMVGPLPVFGDLEQLVDGLFLSGVTEVQSPHQAAQQIDALRCSSKSSDRRPATALSQDLVTWSEVKSFVSLASASIARNANSARSAFLASVASSKRGKLLPTYS